MEQAYILVLETKFCGFNSHLSDQNTYAWLAQLGEQLPYKQWVGGSSPSLCTINPRETAIDSYRLGYCMRWSLTMGLYINGR